MNMNIVDKLSHLSFKRSLIENDKKQQQCMPDYSKDVLLSLDALAGLKMADVKKSENQEVISYGKIKFYPIKSEEEFDELLETLREKSCFEECFDDRVEDKYSAVIHGYISSDLFVDINNYLELGHLHEDTIRRNENLPEKFKESLEIKDSDLYTYARLINYSLKQFDKENEPYQGIVYRYGRVNPNGGRFSSTSKSSSVPIKIAQFGDILEPLNVIQVKKGYDIETIQKSLLQDEKEVLLSPESKFEDITESVPKEEIEKYKKQFTKDNENSDNPLPPERLNELLNNIKFYRQL